MDSNSEGGRSRSGSEGNISPVKEEAYYRSIGGHRKWSPHRTRASDDRYGMQNKTFFLLFYQEIVLNSSAFMSMQDWVSDTFLGSALIF